MKDADRRTERRRERKKHHPEKKADAFILDKDAWHRERKNGLFPARVVEVQKRYAFVAEEPSSGNIKTHAMHLGTVARKFLQTARKERNFIVVGDKVLCRPSEQKQGATEEDWPQCSIEFRAERRTKIARLDPMWKEREHVLAANMDQMVIVASFLSPKIKWGLIDRMLVLAESEQLPVALVLSKPDLLDGEDEAFRKECDTFVELYKGLGYKVFVTQLNLSNFSGKVQKHFKNKVTLCAGHSGVGKSSLVNQMDPEIIQDVELEETLTKGRHTTTYASFIELGTGGFVIDTPGVRSFMIRDMDPFALSSCFVEMRDLAPKCKFRECKHLEEPHCAVKEAVEEGNVSEWRYRSYVAILTGASGREGRVTLD